MHVISCRVRDEVCIGDSVRITVLEVGQDRIRLGVTSPHQFPEYQEQVVYLGDEFGEEETTEPARADRRLVEI